VNDQKNEGRGCLQGKVNLIKRVWYELTKGLGKHVKDSFGNVSDS
jgi:hypothetical protein